MALISLMDAVQAMKEYPDAVSLILLNSLRFKSLPDRLSSCSFFQPAVLVRRHGTYSWGAGTFPFDLALTC